MGLTSTDLTEPYAALRSSNHSWVMLPHNSVWGQQILLAGRTLTQTGTLLQNMVLGLNALRPGMRGNIQGQLITGHPTAIAYTTQQQLHTPIISLISQHSKLIAKIARVAQLASLKLLAGAFQLSCWLELPETPALPAPALVHA